MNIKSILACIIFLIFLESIALGQTNKTDPITINSDKAIFLREKNFIEFSGNVEVKGEDLNIKCNVLHVYLKNLNKNETSQKATKDILKKMIAEGNVHILFQGKEGFCDICEYNMENKKIILLNNVTLIQGKNKIKGDKLIIDLITGKSEVFSSKESRVEIIFYPDNSTNSQ